MQRVSRVAIAVWLVCFVGVSWKYAEAQSLDGSLEITAVVDDGRVIDPTNVLLNYAADGRVIVNGQTVQLIVPMTYQRKQLVFTTDTTKSPMTFDLAGGDKTNGRGIFLPGKDNLVLCLASRDKGRPTSFSSLPGSGNLFVTLKRVGSGGSSLALPAPPETPAYDDAQLRQMLAGTWGHQDADSIHYITLNSDGSMSVVMTWKDNFKRMFHDDVRSSGTWKVENGVVITKIDSSTDKERRGQVGSFRIRSINSSQLVAVDHAGQVRQEWKAPK